MSTKTDKMFLVTNRSASRVYYSVPELGIKSRLVAWKLFAIIF